MTAPTLDRKALHGLPGRVVEAIDPYTEAAEAATLASFLVAFGSVVGPGPHVKVGADTHRANLFATLVGRSSKARKGSSWSPIRTILEGADPSWARDCLVSGLGSGEGLVNAVRDPVDEDDDDAPRDRRALVLATELAAVTKVMSRQGSTLSPVLRDAWDRGDLRVTTRNSPLRATGAHVSIIAHVTEAELRRELTDTEAASGFGNRFLWVAVDRSKLLAEPDPFDADGAAGLILAVRHAIDKANRIGRVERDEDARAIWRAQYPHLSRDRYGLAGTLSDRAEAQVVRLQLLYALADGSPVIRGEHLEAALAFWQYAEDSALHIFGDTLGDPLADRLLAAIVERNGMSRTEIREMAGHSTPAERIDGALQLLEATERARKMTIAGPGRHAERWVPAA